MKHALLAGILTLLATLTAEARIGETPQEITARYGEGRKSNDRLKVSGAETWTYSKAGFTIEVVFLGDKSIWEIIQREGTAITDEDIKGLLKLYDTPATNWRLDRKEIRWERGGKPKLVAYRWPGHPDFFCIKDIEACDTAEKKAKPGASGL